MRFVSPLLLAGLVMVACSASAASDDDLVEYREDGMHVLGGHMGSIGAIVKGKVPFTDDLATHARGLAAQSKLVKGAFKDKAMNGDSEAKSDIWENWDDFAAKADDLESAAAEFADAAGSGDMAAVRAKVGAVGKACKGCHDDYKKD